MFPAGWSSAARPGHSGAVAGVAGVGRVRAVAHRSADAHRRHRHRMHRLRRRLLRLLWRHQGEQLHAHHGKIFDNIAHEYAHDLGDAHHFTVTGCNSDAFVKLSGKSTISQYE